MNNGIKKHIKEILILIPFFAIFISFIACGKDDSKIGLQGFEICYTTDGGNVTRKLNAPQPWSVSFKDSSTSANWVSVNQSSGTGRDTLIDLMFTAEVNNSEQNRRITVVITIGGVVYNYPIIQDGTLIKSCIN